MRRRGARRITVPRRRPAPRRYIDGRLVKNVVVHDRFMKKWRSLIPRELEGLGNCSGHTGTLNELWKMHELLLRHIRGGVEQVQLFEVGHDSGRIMVWAVECGIKLIRGCEIANDEGLMGIIGYMLTEYFSMHAEVLPAFDTPIEDDRATLFDPRGPPAGVVTSTDDGIGTTAKEALYRKVGQEKGVAMLFTMPELGTERTFGHHLAIELAINTACEEAHGCKAWKYMGSIKTTMCGSREHKTYHVFCNTQHPNIINIDDE